MSAEASGVNPWLSLEPGDLRHFITIQAIPTSADGSPAQDAAGQPVPDWQPVRQCWGGINLVSMQEVFGANQLTAQSTDIWTVRWTPVEILPEMQIIFRSKVYRIKAVSNPGKRNIVLHLLCLELNAGS